MTSHIPPLVDLVSESLATRLEARLLCNIFERYSLSDENKAVEQLFHASGRLFDEMQLGTDSPLSDDSLQQILDIVSELSPSAALLWSAHIARRVERIQVEAANCAPTGRRSKGCIWQSLSRTALARCGSLMQAGVKSILLDGIDVDDRFLIALSESAAALTLETLHLRGSAISMAKSSSSWAKCIALTEVDLSDSLAVDNATLDGVLCCPSLHALLAMQCFEVDLLPFAESLLTRNVTKLKKVTITVPNARIGPVWNAFIEALARWPGRFNMETFTFCATALVDEDFNIKSLFTVLPHLSCSDKLAELSWIEPARLATADAAVWLTSVSISNDYHYDSTELSNFMTRLTNLERLSVAGSHLRPPFVHCLHRCLSLQHLELSNVNHETLSFSLLVLPNSLKTLFFMFDEHPAVDRDASERLLVSTVSALPGLRELAISPNEVVSIASVELLLSSLTNLEHLSVSGGFNQRPHSLNPVSHPKLQYLDIFHKGFRFKDSSLPSLRQLRVRSSESFDIILAFAGSSGSYPYMPSLEILDVYFQYMGLFLTESRLSLTMDSIENCFPLLRNLTITSPGFGAEAFDSLCHFSKLTKLAIFQTEISLATVQSILVSLAILESFTCEISNKRITPLDWLKHDRIQHLSLIVMDSTELHFSSAMRLPSLKNLHLGTGPLSTVSLIDMTGLQRFSLQSDLASVSLIIRNCPVLVKCSLADCKDVEITCDRLKSLREIEIARCGRLHLESGFDRQSVPELRLLSSVALGALDENDPLLAKLNSMFQDGHLEQFDIPGLQSWIFHTASKS